MTAPLCQDPPWTNSKIPIDSRRESDYQYARESQSKEPVAARSAAAVQSGSRVLARSRGFSEPHCQTAVGFLLFTSDEHRGFICNFIECMLKVLSQKYGACT